ncbi:MAG: inorganic phosphate transporter [Bacteroidales bacterium]|nr:inorganic phosphate transporter [Bacteroidales bacterium]MDY0198664.1 inorganic phosphate transporter [Tenuifilaceae bacterium]
MLFLVFLSSGLFLGWSLGANDASNIFGSAVGSKMVSFRKAAWIASIFVVIGAVFQGHGAANTLTDLGSVDALAGAFTVSLCAAIAVFLMTRSGLPVSTSQAVVGAIIGWSAFTGHQTNLSVLWRIMGTWIASPILGMIFSALLFLLVRYILRKSKIHVIKLDSLLRFGLIAVAAFGAYSLGANNIANVMGVFVPSAPNIVLNFGLFSINGVQVLFFLGGIAISIGIFTYSRRVMETLGKGILDLTPEAAFVVILAQALVLFLFSSSSFSAFLDSIGLPPFPLVPVSSTQIVVGAVMGIGIIKGGLEIKFKLLRGIGIGWLTTPLAAGFLTYLALFFVQNVFGLEVSSTIDLVEELANPSKEGIVSHLDLTVPAIMLIIFVLLVLLVYLVLRQQKLRLKAENQVLHQQNQSYTSSKALNELEIRAIQMQNTMLTNKLELKRQELNTILMNISEQRTFLENIAIELCRLIGIPDIQKRDAKLNELTLLLRQRMSFTKEIDDFYERIDKTHKNFQLVLVEKFPDLTDNEKRLAMLLRLNFASKEIATLMNITPKSVEIARYRLRKKLQLKERENLTEFLKSL